MIDGVVVEKLKVIGDDRGKVMHMLRGDSPLFKAMGEIYFSTVNTGVVKAWKYHLRMTQLFAVPVGKIKLVIYDNREGSSTKGEVQELHIGEENYCLVRIPPRLWYGFQGEATAPSLIVNCADIPHDPLEIQRAEPSSVELPHVW